MSRQLPTPILSEDLLYLVAENMLFSKPLNKKVQNLMTPEGAMDLSSTNSYVTFMCLNPSTFRVFIAHFIKMKTIAFKKETDDEDGYTIELYKDRTVVRAPVKSCEFQGPYLVSKGFINRLIDNAKLRVQKLISQNYLGEQAPQIDLGSSAMKAFCALFLNRELDDETDSDVPLALSKLEVSEPVQIIETNIAPLMALNTVEIAIKEAEVFPASARKPAIADCSNMFFIAPAERTRRIVYEFDLEMSPCSRDLDGLGPRWRSVVHFLLTACPNLQSLQFKVFCTAYRSPAEFLTDVYHLLSGLVDDVLPQLSIGGTQAEISINFDAWCSYDEELTTDTHELFEMGIPIHPADEGDDLKKRRRCVVTDMLGRKHTCEFNIALPSID